MGYCSFATFQHTMTILTRLVPNVLTSLYRLHKLTAHVQGYVLGVDTALYAILLLAVLKFSVMDV